MKNISDQLRARVLLRMGFIFSMKHRIFHSIYLPGELLVWLFVSCEAEMLSLFTTKAST